MEQELRDKFIQAYDDYSDGIYRYCFFRVYSSAIAEEIVQETFMRLWESMLKGNKIKNIKPFTYKICHNLIIDSYRNNETKQLSLDILIYPSKNYHVVKSAEGINSEKNILYNEILQTLEKLPPNYKNIIILRYIEDLPPREIAEMMDSTPQKISAQIYRALQKLKFYITKI